MSVLSLADAQKHLNLNGNTQNVELQAMIDSAESTLSHWCGPLGPRPVTQAVSVARGSGAAWLSVVPVASLTSVTRLGSAIDVTTVTFDSESGQLDLRAGTYAVTYVAGWDPVPADLLLAVKELVRHFWLTQRGSGTRPGQGQPATQPGVGYLLPYRVQELIAPYVPVVLA